MNAARPKRPGMAAATQCNTPTTQSDSDFFKEHRPDECPASKMHQTALQTLIAVRKRRN